MGSRRKGRILAFQAVFGWDFAATPLKELLEFDWLDEDRKSKFDSETLTFARLLVQGTLENLSEVDDAITNQLKNWDFNRLSRVDLAIMRMSVYALLYQSDIPASVTIDEAVDIGKEFGTDDSYKFINGVLDGIRRAREA
jgi:transcription antitermination protein NusB